MKEAADALNVSLRFLQGFLATIPPCHLQAGRRKLFDDASDRNHQGRNETEGPGMPYELKPPAPDRSPYWRVRGTDYGIRIDRST